MVRKLVLQEYLQMTTNLRTLMDELRALAKSPDLDQVFMVRRNIDEYLKARADRLSLALEHLRTSLHEEERANRPGEDWSPARDYVRRLLPILLVPIQQVSVQGE